MYRLICAFVIHIWQDRFTHGLAQLNRLITGIHDSMFLAFHLISSLISWIIPQVLSYIRFWVGWIFNYMRIKTAFSEENYAPPPHPQPYQFILGANLRKMSVSLKIRSRSTKSNHFFPQSQWWFCASLVRRHIFTVLIEWWPWKLCQGHQKQTKSFNCPNDIIYKIWSKSIISLKR